jgi:hypothetical protein
VIDSPYKTDQELHDAAFLALREALGPEDALRFVRLYRSEPGDYTEERLLHTGDRSIDEIMESIEAHKQSASGRHRSEGA